MDSSISSNAFFAPCAPAADAKYGKYASS